MIHVEIDWFHPEFVNCGRIDCLLPAKIYRKFNARQHHPRSIPCQAPPSPVATAACNSRLQRTPGVHRACLKNLWNFAQPPRNPKQNWRGVAIWWFMWKWGTTSGKAAYVNEILGQNTHYSAGCQPGCWWSLWFLFLWITDGWIFGCCRIICLIAITKFRFQRWKHFQTSGV